MAKAGLLRALPAAAASLFGLRWFLPSSFGFSSYTLCCKSSWWGQGGGMSPCPRGWGSFAGTCTASPKPASVLPFPWHQVKHQNQRVAIFETSCLLSFSNKGDATDPFSFPSQKLSRLCFKNSENNPLLCNSQSRVRSFLTYVKWFRLAKLVFGVITASWAEAAFAIATC